MSAKRLLNVNGALPVIFRQQDQQGPFVCQFVADLLEIHFRTEFGDDQPRLAWLEDHLWLQRKTIEAKPRTAEFPTWESQYKAWEIDKFMSKFMEGNQPLSPDYTRSYSLCHYPEADIRLIPKPESAA